jgi:hypothetical protein
MKINGTKWYNLKLKLKDLHHLFNNKQLNITFDVNIHIFCNYSKTLFKNDKFHRFKTEIEIPKMIAAYYSIEIKPVYSKCPVNECPLLKNNSIVCQKCENILFYIHLNGTINHEEFKSITSDDLNSIITHDFDDSIESHFCSLTYLNDYDDNYHDHDHYHDINAYSYKWPPYVVLTAFIIITCITIYACRCNKTKINCKSVCKIL